MEFGRNLLILAEGKSGTLRLPTSGRATPLRPRLGGVLLKILTR
jgi:hypothetical protein